MPNLDSCYELLGLRRGASQEEVRSAFQRLAQQLYTGWEGRVADGTVLNPSIQPLELAKPIAFVVRVSP